MQSLCLSPSLLTENGTTTQASRKRPHRLLQKVNKQIRAKGFQVADFSGHEYDPYFMKDTIHIGWKGWVYVDKAIDEFYKTGKVTSS